MSQQFVERFRARKPNSSPLRAPEPDESFSYLVGRAVTVWPEINGNQAAFVEEDFGLTKGLKQFIGTDKGFTFGLVNANHSVGPGKSNMVLGSIREEAWAQDGGVDLVAQIDKRACAAYDVEPEEFMEKGGLNSFSIEIACDRELSTFVAMTNPASKKIEDQTVFTAEEAASQGIRRTSWVEPSPYLYQDKHLVVELCSPIRCRGVAVLPDPADKTANVFEVAASLENAGKEKHPEPYGDVPYADPGFRGKKRYPLDEEHIHAAISYWGRPENRAKYSQEQQDHISAEIDKYKKKYGIGDEEKSSFALTDVPALGQAIPNYADIDAVDVDAAMGADMPDDAFADTYFNPEECADERAYPLYASPAHYVQNKPHPGLVKAALQAHADGKIHNRQSALQRLKVAHSQLHGAKSMDDKEQLATELAGVKTKLAEVQATLESKDAAITDKDTEIAGLKDENKKLTDEIAALKSEKEAKAAEELASKRLAELAAVEGFSVKDEEKAALLDTLKTEDQLAFENRVLKVKIASMEEAAKKKPMVKNDNDKDDEEDAGLLAKVALTGLDFVPSAPAKEGEVDIFTIM